MNYTESLNYIHSIPKFRRPLGNENLSRLLFLLGDPQKKLRFVHVAGTNGKGSVAAMTERILRECGYKTGLFTSPFIERFNERIRVNGENISDGAMAEYTERVKNIMETSGALVSEFAFVTAAAFLYFYEKNCDIVVLEVGMGGKLDATNVIDESVVSVICKIALDHTQYLGDTVEEITREKCGIIREGGRAIAYPNEKRVTDIIRAYADAKNASLTVADVRDADGYELSLKGEYQKYNAAVVIETVRALREKGFDIPEAAVIEGLKNTRHAARFELVRDDLIIDGAHNADGMRALKASLDALKRPYVIVIAMMEDKSWEECARIIAADAAAVTVTELSMPRCVKAEKIAKALEGIDVPVIVNNNPIDALLKAFDFSEDILVCVCGSLYLAGEVRKKISKTENNACK